MTKNRNTLGFTPIMRTGIRNDKSAAKEPQQISLSIKDALLAIVLSTLITCIAVCVGRGHSLPETEYSAPTTRAHAKGFTLIEMSIVLVIIGLIVGGILAGRDLIATSTVRAQITQIEKFHQATNTFYGKYGYLPGDIPASAAAQFGFAARGVSEAEGDGNGIIEGLQAITSTPDCCSQGGGETVMFWVDLSTSHLIDATFDTATAAGLPPGNITVRQNTTPSLVQYLPQARIAGDFIMAFSSNGSNYFNISQVTSINAITSSSTITVAQAYSIDRKTDDGLPQTGNVMATYLNVPIGYEFVGATDQSATSRSPTTCYDNGGVAGTQQYSLGQNNGAGTNCALSFRFQ